MDNKMWFGNRNHMQWIACPEVGADYGSQGNSQSGAYLNGGAFHRQTLNAAKRWSFNWSMTSRDTVRKLTDYVEGVYGPGLIYWTDPFTMDRNVLPQSWAVPALGAEDAITLDGSDTRPTLVATSANSLGYPPFSAVYSVASNANVRRLYVPIPPGHKAWVGVHGGTSTGRVMVQPTSGVNPTGSPTAVPVASVAAALFSHSFSAPAGVGGIELYLEKGKNYILSGLMVQVLPNGQSPNITSFVSGQGASGAQFDGFPSKEAYSAAFDLVGVSAEFIETEQWL